MADEVWMDSGLLIRYDEYPRSDDGSSSSSDGQEDDDDDDDEGPDEHQERQDWQKLPGPRRSNSPSIRREGYHARQDETVLENSRNERRLQRATEYMNGPSNS